MQIDVRHINIRLIATNAVGRQSQRVLRISPPVFDWSSARSPFYLELPQDEAINAECEACDEAPDTAISPKG